MRILASVFGVAALCAAASAAAESPEGSVVRQADGSFTVTQPIEAEPAQIAWNDRGGEIATATGTAEDAAALLAREAAEQDLERAYEEAVDFTRSESTASQPQ